MEQVALKNLRFEVKTRRRSERRGNQHDDPTRFGAQVVGGVERGRAVGAVAVVDERV